MRELRSSSKEDYERETNMELSKGEETFGKRFRYFAVLGAALSPDLSILLIIFPTTWLLTPRLSLPSLRF